MVLYFPNELCRHSVGVDGRSPQTELSVLSDIQQRTRQFLHQKSRRWRKFNIKSDMLFRTIKTQHSASVFKNTPSIKL